MDIMQKGSQRFMRRGPGLDKPALWTVPVEDAESSEPWRFHISEVIHSIYG